MANRVDSIFRQYYTNEPFVDRLLAEPDGAVDVIIPVIHSNELWESNLRSFYREIPVHRLLIGDGGCIDDTIKIARRYPRVEIFDHRHFKSLGYSIRKLIEAVETKWFVYLHSDVYLPEGWFGAMRSHQAEYDWFGCPMRHTIMVEYPVIDKIRPYAGSQMGRKAVFEEGLTRIEDDYVYRQEDFVLADLVEKNGFKHGRIEDTFHYHQITYKPSPWVRKIRAVSIDLDMDKKEEIRTYAMQVRGIVKYLEPNPNNIAEVQACLCRLLKAGEWEGRKLKRWVAETNPAWSPHIRKCMTRARIIIFLRTVYRHIFERTPAYKAPAV